MADTRTIYLHTGTETFSSDPTDTQYNYLDMSDYDSLNPEFQSTIKLSNGVAGIYEDTKAKITLTFKGANSGRDERAEWVNKYAERINKISVSSTNNKGQVFNKSATVSYVEFIDTPYIDGVQVQIEVTMFGRWQSALSIIETVTEKYESGSKAYLGDYPDFTNRNYIKGSLVSISKNNQTMDNLISSVPTSTFSGKKITISVNVKYENIDMLKDGDRMGVEFVFSTKTGNIWAGAWKYPNNGDSFDGRISQTFDFSNVELEDNFNNSLNGRLYIFTSSDMSVQEVYNPQLEIGDTPTPYKQAPEDFGNTTKPHYNYDYRYGKTTLLNQISLPKDRNRFMLAIDSNYTVATITLSAGGKRATISTSRLNTNSSISSDFVAYDITEFVDTDKFLLLTSGLVASVVWDNLASQYAVLYNIMNSVGDTPADISVTTTGGQHIPFKLYTYSVQDFI